MSEDSRAKKTWKKLRRHERVSADVPVRMSTIEPDLDPLTGRAYFRASQERCSTLSRGGAFIETTELLDPGRRVLLEISLPEGGQVEAIGRVAWTQRKLSAPGDPKCGVGVEFLGGATEDFKVLEEFVSRHGNPSKKQRSQRARSRSQGTQVA